MRDKARNIDSEKAERSKRRPPEEKAELNQLNSSNSSSSKIYNSSSQQNSSFDPKRMLKVFILCAVKIIDVFLQVCLF
ncbi:hypothetical protein AYI70_g10030 [Smittium culicis]|nr:hypothetical protein AYI70_g10030 [Smittium culicis]